MAKQKNYIPHGDDEFDVFFKNIAQQVTKKTGGANPSWTRIPKTAVTELNEVYSAWFTAYAPTLKPHTTPETNEKNRLRVDSEKKLRHFVNQYLRHSDEVSDQDRDYMEIGKGPEPRRQSGGTDSLVEFGFRLRDFREVIVDFKVRGSKSKARPNGCDGALIVFAALDKPPASIKDLTRHELATRTPYALKMEEADRGKRVYVAICWQSNTGQLGSWSEIQSTIVP